MTKKNLINQHLVEATAHLGEALEPSGKKWAVTILDEGWSKNQRYYSRESVSNYAHLFEGAWVGVDHVKDAEQQARPEGSISRRAGVVRNVEVIEGEDGKFRMDGELHVILPWVGEALLRAQEAGAPGWAALSIDAYGNVEQRHNTELGKVVPTVTGFTKVQSVDLVTVPATGGGIRRVLESQEYPDMNPEELVTQLREAIKEDLATMVPTMVRDQLTTALREAAGEDVDEDESQDEDELFDEGEDGVDGEAEDWDDEEGDEDEEEDDEDEDEDPVQESLSMARREIGRLRESFAETQARMDAQAAAAAINGQIEASGLPLSLQGLARQRLAAEARAGGVTDAVVKMVLKETRDIWAEMAQTNPSSGPGLPGGVMSITGKGEQYQQRLLATFGDTSYKVAPFRSLQEAYCVFTGANQFDLHPQEIFRALLGTGYDSAFSSKRVREALTTASWGDVFADVMYNRVGKIYNDLPYDEWRQLCSDITNSPDFMPQSTTVYGGYGNIPVVAENDPYLALSSPGDQRTSWQIAKRGGTEVITLEMVVNNKLGVVTKIPNLLAYAAKRTLYEFSMDMITRSAPVMTYDSTAMYDASHGNVDEEELTVQGLDAVEQAHMAQVPFGQPSNEVLGVRGEVKFVIVSRAQRLRAQTLLKPSDRVRYDGMTMDSTQIDPGAFSDRGMQAIVYDRLSGSTWYTSADPKAPGVNGLVIGFLGGRQEPELFVQDNPTVGEAMSHDRINFKVRHIYGGTVSDHRTYAKHVPA